MQPSSQLYPGIHTYLKMLASTHTRPSMAHVRHDDDWLSDVRQHPVARSVIHQCAAVPGNQSIGKVHLQRLCTHHLLTRQMQKLLTVLPEHPCNCALLHSSMQASTLHSRFKRPHTGLPTTPAPIPRGDELSSMQSACQRQCAKGPHVWVPLAITLGASPAAGAAPVIIAGAGAAASDGAGAGAGASNISASQSHAVGSMLTFSEVMTTDLLLSDALPVNSLLQYSPSPKDSRSLAIC